MSRIANWLARLGLLPVLAWLIFGAPASAAPSGKAPNIVFILADDLGWAENSIFADRGGHISTPNLERLAKSGARFSHAYVTAAICAPSRAGLLTGRYQQRGGYNYNPPEDLAVPELGLDPHELTLGDLMKRQGYHTGLVGKWHLGSGPEHYPTNRGFDEFFGILYSATNYISADTPGLHIGKTFVPPRTERDPLHQVFRGPNSEVVPDFHTYVTEEFATQAVDFIDRNADKPFFLYAPFTAPHGPLEVTAKYYDRFPNIKDDQARIYAAMVSALDDGVGRILQALDKHGLRDNTMVVFLSDNGCPAYLNGVCTCQPLRGGKLSQYEGGVRSPMILSWPGHIRPGTTYEKTVSSLDIVPTVMAATGSKLPDDRTYDGVDLVPYLRGQEGEPHKVLYWVRDPYRAILDGPWKLWISTTGKERFLFNIADDPNETNNLFKARPDKVKALGDALERWRKTLPTPQFPNAKLVKSNYCGVDLELPL